MAAVIMMAAAGTQANVTLIKSNTVENRHLKEAGVYFSGQVNNQTVAWLLSSVSEIRENYHNVENVDLYINSPGGDMDAGYLAYETLLSSPLKISMINASMTASSATLIYCASQARYSMPMAQFILHPAAAFNEKADYLRPDQARQILEDAENYNAIFRKVYASCTTLSQNELQKITESNAGRAIYHADEAVSRGLARGGIRKSRSYALTYYITDGQS